MTIATITTGRPTTCHPTRRIAFVSHSASTRVGLTRTVRLTAVEAVESGTLPLLPLLSPARTLREPSAHRDVHLGQADARETPGHTAALAPMRSRINRATSSKGRRALVS